MYEEFNAKAKYGVQYFEIENYKQYSDSVLLNKIIQFSEEELSSNNLMPPKVYNQFFYKKTLLGGCRDLRKLWEAAADGEYQDIPDCDDEEIAHVWILTGLNTKLPPRDTVKRLTILRSYNFRRGNKYYTREDSLHINGTHWKTFHKGIIEEECIKFY